MTSEELKQELLSFMKPACNFYDVYLKVSKITNGYNLHFGGEYQSPPLGFERLKQLSDLFGTVKIDVNDYANSGCETCDYGSNYGNDIQITNLTKNQEQLEFWVGKDLYAKTN